jgi:predicted TIM-barrel fold metal-dependent hydrolase
VHYVRCVSAASIAAPGSCSTEHDAVSREATAVSQPASDHYVVISSDGHAGADLWDYKAYLAEEFHDEFDAWAKGFTEPWAEYDKELADTDDPNIRLGVASASSLYNWDSDRRLEHLDAEGICAEVLFPNTVPPFYPSGPVTAPAPTTPEEYRYRRAGVQAHNRWMVDFCAQAPGRRAGLAQVFLTDIDDAIADARWAKESGLAGVLIPGDHISHLVNLYERRLDPFWAACADMDIAVHRHAIAVGPPETEDSGPAVIAVGARETHLFFQRGLGHLVLAGVFERFPDLRFVFTETGCVWIANELRKLDAEVRMGKLKGTTAYPLYHRVVEDLHHTPTEYFQRNCHVGASLMMPADIDVRHDVGVDHVMWGNDYPHHEGSYPYTKLAMRLLFSGVPEDEARKMLGTNAAEVYGFDLDALQPLADRIGPTVDEIAEPVRPEELPATSLGHTVSNAVMAQQALSA